MHEGLRGIPKSRCLFERECISEGEERENTRAILYFFAPSGEGEKCLCARGGTGSRGFVILRRKEDAAAAATVLREREFWSVNVVYIYWEEISK